MTRDDKITSLVCSSRGTKTAEVAELFGLAGSSMGAILSRLCAEGRIAKTAPLGPTLMWCSPSLRAELVAATKAEMRARKLRQHSERTRNRRARDAEARAAAKAAAQPVDEDGPDSWPVVQRVVSAANAKPLKLPRIINSVWGLAG